MGLHQAVAGALLLYVFTKTLYNLYLHPLASYNGPLLWRAFQFPSLAAMLGGTMPYRVKQLHDQYGPIVRIAPNELSIIDDRAWKDIFQRRDFLRPSQWGARPPGIDAHNLISAPADVHARFRKAFAPAFSERETQGYEPLIRRYFDKLINSLHTKSRGNVDLMEWFNFTTFDIIGELCWGQSFDCLESGKGHAFISVLLHFKAATIATCIKYYPAIDALIPYITPKSALAMLYLVFDTGHQRIQQRISGQIEPRQPDVLSHVLQYNRSNPKSNALSQEEIEFNALTMIIAGSETLTTALCGAVHYLLLNPSVYESLTSEIRSNLISAEQISASNVSSLPYLNAVLNETLRLCPPIPDSMRRVVPTGGATVAGLHYLEGTVLGVSCWSVFQSEQYFSNPTVFAPERWLGEGKGESHHNAQAYNPFSLGPHGCLGKPLAWLEMRLLLSLLLFHFDIEASPKATPWKWSEQAIYWTWEKKPLLVNVKRRST